MTDDLDYGVTYARVNHLHIVYLFLGGYIVLFGVISYFIKHRMYLSEALVTLFVGVILGPYAIDLVNPYEWGDHEFVNVLTLEFTRFVLAIQVIASGISLPRAFFRRDWKSLLVLLGPVMVCMWLTSGLGIWIFVPHISFVDALLIAACVTPTDPVLANSAVKGRFADKHVPLHVQNILSAESGANDGAGFPFFFFALLWITRSHGKAVAQFFYWGIVYQILLSIVIGFVAGVAARELLKIAEKRRWTDKESLLVYSIGLAIFLMGVNTTIGSDDLLSCFIAGACLSWDDWFHEKIEEAHFQEVIENLLNYAVFLYIGAIIPWDDYSNSDLGLNWWRLLCLGLFILILRRVPFVLALRKIMPVLHTNREAFFVGWFGPIGVGAIFYAALAIDEIKEEDEKNHRVRSLVFPVVSFLVLCSIIAHGVTIPLLLLGRRIKGKKGSILHHEEELHKMKMKRRERRALKKKELAKKAGIAIPDGHVSPVRLPNISGTLDLPKIEEVERLQDVVEKIDQIKSEKDEVADTKGKLDSLLSKFFLSQKERRERRRKNAKEKVQQRERERRERIRKRKPRVFQEGNKIITESADGTVVTVSDEKELLGTKMEYDSDARASFDSDRPSIDDPRIRQSFDVRPSFDVTDAEGATTDSDKETYDEMD